MLQVSQVVAHHPLERHRFIVADGAADKAELDRLWTEDAETEKVNVKRQQ